LADEETKFSHQQNRGSMKLSELGVGKSGIIKTVGGEKALRRHLLDMGLTPRTEVMVRKVAPLGDPIELNLRGYELTLRKDDAKMIDIADPKSEFAKTAAEKSAQAYAPKPETKAAKPSGCSDTESSLCPTCSFYNCPYSKIKKAEK